MNLIWTKKGDVRGATAEAVEIRFQVADLLVEELATSIVDFLGLPSGLSTDIFKSTLRKHIKDSLVGGRNCLLEQYLNSQLEQIGDNINKAFGLDESICDDYAPHAKLNRHIKAIQQKFNADN